MKAPGPRFNPMQAASLFILLVLVPLVIYLAIWAHQDGARAKQACEQSGGELVQTASGGICVRAEALIGTERSR